MSVIAWAGKIFWAIIWCTVLLAFPVYLWEKYAGRQAAERKRRQLP